MIQLAVKQFLDLMSKSIKKLLFYFILLILTFIILEIISSLILFKRYSSKNLIIGLNKTNSHFLYLASKVVKKSLKKLGYVKEEVRRPFYDKYFYDPIELLDNKEWEKNFENIYKEPIQNIKKQLNTFESLRYNYRTPSLDYIYTNPNRKLSKYEENIIYFENLERKSFKNNADKFCWIFGGSTVFGDRLKNSQTISSELNKIQSNYLFLNFGLPGYNSNLQMRYLINLIKLKKNNLPNCVIFFDGINDSLDPIKSPLIHPIEKSSDPNLIFKSSTEKKFKFDYKYSPFGNNFNEKLSELLKYNIEELSRQTTGIKFELRDNKFEIANDDIIIKLTADNFIDNAKIVKSILKSVDEKIVFKRFLQPNSSLDKKNPFIKKKFFDSNLYFLSKSFYDYLKLNYKDEFIDLSHLSDYCTKDCYVDEGHYSPNFIAIIADNIIKELN